MEDDLKWKKTSKIRTWNISATTDPIFLKFETQVDDNKPNAIETLNEDNLSWKMTPCGRRPKN